MIVLVVDEHASMRATICDLLHQLGYDDTLEAADGQNALMKMRAIGVGMVIAEWNMTPMSGRQLRAAMRADPKLRDIRFIAVTAASENDADGDVAVLVAPFDAAALQAGIDAAQPV